MDRAFDHSLLGLVGFIIQEVPSFSGQPPLFIVCNLRNQETPFAKSLSNTFSERTSIRFGNKIEGMGKVIPPSSDLIHFVQAAFDVLSGPEGVAVDKQI